MDSFASGNTLATPPPSVDSHNNTNWEFISPLSGSTSGTSETSPQRRIVQNQYGFWIFFNQSGAFSYSSSVDGINWNSTSPKTTNAAAQITCHT